MINIIDEILQKAGFVENVTYIEEIFRQPPNKTFVVYFDEIQTDGSDDTTDIENHSVRFELYSLNKKDKAAENQVEKVLSEFAIHYTKIKRVWIQTEKYYLTTYEFDFTKKIEEN